MRTGKAEPDPPRLIQIIKFEVTALLPEFAVDSEYRNYAERIRQGAPRDIERLFRALALNIWLTTKTGEVS